MTNPNKREDTADVKRVELSVHTQMSAVDSVLSLQELIHTADRWGWKAVAVTDYGSVQAFPDAMRIIQGRNLNIKVIYGMEGFLTDDDYVNSPVNHITILAKNKTGLNNLYKLVSLSHIQYFHRKPLLPKRVLENHREGLIIGSAGINGELIQAIISYKKDEELLQIADFYDYLEIQPSTNYSLLLTNEIFPDISSDEDLRSINRRIVDISKKINKPVVATGDVHYLNSMDAMSLNIIRHEVGNKQNEIRASRYLRTTDDMLTKFDYLGSQTAYETVVINSNRISDMIENLTPMVNESYLPVLPNADEDIKKNSCEKAHMMYGQKIPSIVRNRMEDELSIIIKHGYSSVYLISQKLTHKLYESGCITCTRGSVGSSLIAYLLGITEVNPLPPHYRCPKCKYSMFIIDGMYASGFDLPNKMCPNCGAEFIKDGHDIPHATFLAFDGSRKPDIDINFSGEQEVFYRCVQELMGKDKVYGAGTIETVSYHEAQSYVDVYLRKMKKVPYLNSVQTLVDRCVGTKKSTKAHPAAVLVNITDKDIHHFTPIQYADGNSYGNPTITHFDYHYLSNVLFKMDVISLKELELLKVLSDKTGISFRTIPFNDACTISLFNSIRSLDMMNELSKITTGTLGIIGFQTPEICQILCETKPNSFSDLVKASALYHGTNVWHGNARDLIKNGVCTIRDVVATRDDIMMYLIQEGVQPIIAFNVMESVRKGKGIRQDYIERLNEHGIPQWYNESCKKIRYLFPRAHVVDYVTLGYRTAYYKAHFPDEFYRAYFEIYAKDADIDVIKSGISAVREEIKRYDVTNEEEKNYERFVAFQLALEMLQLGYHL